MVCWGSPASALLHLHLFPAQPLPLLSALPGPLSGSSSTSVLAFSPMLEATGSWGPQPCPVPRGPGGQGSQEVQVLTWRRSTEYASPGSPQCAVGPAPRSLSPGGWCGRPGPTHGGCLMRGAGWRPSPSKTRSWGRGEGIRRAKVEAWGGCGRILGGRGGGGKEYWGDGCAWPLQGSHRAKHVWAGPLTHPDPGTALGCSMSPASNVVRRVPSGLATSIWSRLLSTQ